MGGNSVSNQMGGHGRWYEYGTPSSHEIQTSPSDRFKGLFHFPSFLPSLLSTPVILRYDARNRGLAPYVKDHTVVTPIKTDPKIAVIHALDAGTRNVFNHHIINAQLVVLNASLRACTHLIVPLISSAKRPSVTNDKVLMGDAFPYIQISELEIYTFREISEKKRDQ